MTFDRTQTLYCCLAERPVAVDAAQQLKHTVNFNTVDYETWVTEAQSPLSA